MKVVNPNIHSVNDGSPIPISIPRGRIFKIERKPNNKIILIVAGNLTGVIRVLKAFCGWSGNITPIRSAYVRANYRLNDQWQEVEFVQQASGKSPFHYFHNRTVIYMNSPYQNDAPNDWIMQGKVKRGSVGLFANLLGRR